MIDDKDRMTMNHRNHTGQPVERPLRNPNGQFAQNNDFGKHSRKRPKGALGWLKLLRQRTTEHDWAEVLDYLLETAKGKTDGDANAAQRLLFKYLIPTKLLENQAELERQHEMGNVSTMMQPWLETWLEEMAG